MNNNEARKIVVQRLRENVMDIPESKEAFDALDKIIDQPGVFPAVIFTAAAGVAVAGQEGLRKFIELVLDCTTLLPEEEEEKAA